jgi:2-oxoglutarate dehydrogenase E1 component
MNHIVLNSNNLTFLERLYEDYRQNPASVPEDWQEYFENLSRSDGTLRPSKGTSQKAGSNGSPAKSEVEAANRQDRVDQLIRAFRVRGHIIAQIAST